MLRRFAAIPGLTVLSLSDRGSLAAATRSMALPIGAVLEYIHASAVCPIQEHRHGGCLFQAPAMAK